MNVHNFVIFITCIVNIFTYNKDIEKVITSQGNMNTHHRHQKQSNYVNPKN